MGSDVVTAREACGGMWVYIRHEKGAEPTLGCTVFSGMHLEVLELAPCKAWLRVRSASLGINNAPRQEGWVRSQDVTGLGEASLQWSDEEIHLEENVADQPLISLQPDIY